MGAWTIYAMVCDGQPVNECFIPDTQVWWYQFADSGGMEGIYDPGVRFIC